MSLSATDEHWLLQAIALAESCPSSSSAFSVGAIIVDRSGAEISRGYSREIDSFVHAEESALAKAAGNERLKGATIYSSLEPCGERKSRPKSCAQLIIESGITTVFFAWREPSMFIENPAGVRLLERASILVVERPEITSPNYNNM